MGTKKKKSKQSAKSWKIGSVFFKVVLWFFIVTVGITILYRWINPPITPLMISRKLFHDATITKKWTNIENISPYLIKASIASEDNRFLAHNGFDFSAIQKAINERKNGVRKRGASTISQQTAKNVFLTPHQSWIRKGFEVYFTILIELFWSKERIMEVYLNVIEFGDGLYGCEAASNYYFHTSANKLTQRQAALMVACYPNPRKRNPSKPTTYLNNRANSIINLIPKLGKIDFDKETIVAAEKRYENQEEKRIKKNGGKRIQL